MPMPMPLLLLSPPPPLSRECFSRRLYSGLWVFFISYFGILHLSWSLHSSELVYLIFFSACTNPDGSNLWPNANINNSNVVVVFVGGGTAVAVLRTHFSADLFWIILECMHARPNTKSWLPQYKTRNCIFLSDTAHNSWHFHRLILIHRFFG